jgi:hypothetical protein
MEAATKGAGRRNLKSMVVLAAKDIFINDLKCDKVGTFFASDVSKYVEGVPLRSIGNVLLDLSPGFVYQTGKKRGGANEYRFDPSAADYMIKNRDCSYRDLMLRF